VLERTSDVYGVLLFYGGNFGNKIIYEKNVAKFVVDFEKKLFMVVDICIIK
jgi:hypothetical protein